MITTKGRLLTDVQLVYQEGEILIFEYQLQQGEQVAILIDASRNRARLNAPFEECQALALRHQYELSARVLTCQSLGRSQIITAAARREIFAKRFSP